MSLVHSFPPVADANAAILILGTMPGEASLRAGEYYAHPRNHFWPIMGELYGASPALPYATRLEILMSRGLAVWDVFKCCVRPGSLDSCITNETFNDFPAFFAAHPAIRRVCFNGAKAHSAFRKFVAPILTARPLDFALLPSTSPANASWSFERKLAGWDEALWGA